MKTFEFLISESFATSFDIEANTKEEAEDIAQEEWLWHESKYDGDQNVFFPNDVHIEEVIK